LDIRNDITENFSNIFSETTSASVLLSLKILQSELDFKATVDDSNNIEINETDIFLFLEKLILLEEGHSDNVLRSRLKDAQRGCEVFEDYNEVNEFVNGGNSDGVTRSAKGRVSHYCQLLNEHFASRLSVASTELASPSTSSTTAASPINTTTRAATFTSTVVNADTTTTTTTTTTLGPTIEISISAEPQP